MCKRCNAANALTSGFCPPCETYLDKTRKGASPTYEEFMTALARKLAALETANYMKAVKAFGGSPTLSF